ncbi:hypothetical protein DFP72DRAFT_876356 [Ephemerocybe angulata]|uniref:Uncharacterized protein n=1 Tax=Ephemerocybe angulata TaxID=980116 RepID=A0A8H6MB37_9AGAR|nr:hypothetical protein DFP72DRAFT_876356 [Tulosesus angulatus]
MLSRTPKEMLAVVVLLLSMSLTMAVPWAGGLRSSIASTSGGIMTYIEAMGPHSLGEGITRHLSGQAGEPGNVTIGVNVKNPSIFFVQKNQLYQYINDTTILPVNVYNVTINKAPPLQLILGKQPDGLKGGSWRFAGSMLYYDFPGRDESFLKENNPEYLKYFRSQGLFYHCAFPNAKSGVFMFYYLQDSGVSCTPFTLHSFMHEKKK